MFGFHWYFLAVAPPLPEALIGAEPELYLEQVMGRWAGSVPGADAITPEAMAAYVAAFTPAVIAASCADYRAGATFDADLDDADRAAGRTIGRARSTPCGAIGAATPPTTRSSPRGGGGRRPISR